jgi:hypothetical protein
VVLGSAPTVTAPKELDDETLCRLARSFYLVRMVRHACLVVAATCIAVLSAVTEAPPAVTVILAGLGAAFAVAMVSTRTRYVRSRRRPAPSSPSPTG